MVKKVLCLLLLLCVLLPTVIACSKNGDGGADSSLSTDSDTEVDESTQEESGGAPIPYMEDFGGYKFRVLTRGSGSFTGDDITGDMSGSILSQATYRRNAYCKDKYNFDVVEYKEKKWVEKARTVAASSEDVYDMWSFNMNDIPSLAQEGYLYDLNKVSGINLDAEYYDQTARKQGSFANRLFYLTGDLLYWDDFAVMCLAFNWEIWKNNSLSDMYGKDPYELVESGEWTLDKYIALCKKATYDTGDGIMDENDYWGTTIANTDILTYNIGMGNELLMKDNDDLFILNDTPKQINDLTTLMAFFSDSSCCTETLAGQATFMRGYALFASMAFGSLGGSVRTNLEDYGVVPFPKADVDQTDYFAFVSTYQSNCITIANSVKDVDKTASIIELLSYESMSTLTPATEKYLFEGRSVDHAEDVEMMRICVKNKKYELCWLWDTGSLYSTMTDVKKNSGTGITSAFQSCKSAVEESVQRKLERLSVLP